MLAARGTLGGLRAAFVSIGLAALCRQNFALFMPFLLLAFVPWKRLPEAVTMAASDIEAFPEVQAVEYVTEAQALARARAELREPRTPLVAQPTPRRRSTTSPGALSAGG